MHDLSRALQELSRQDQAPPLQNVPLFVPIAVQQFRRYKFPTFDGDSDPLAIEEQIRGLKRIF